MDVEPVAAVPADQVAVHEPALVDHLAQHLLEREPRHAGRQVEEPVSRQYFDMRTSFTGPILTKVWNTPENGYAERFKHVVEPEFVVQRTTKFDDYDQIVKIEGGDYTYGGTTRLTYGVTNRFLARRRAGADGAPAARAREFINVQLQQSYYSNPQRQHGRRRLQRRLPRTRAEQLLADRADRPRAARPTRSGPRCASSTTRSSTSSRRSR